MLTIDDEVRSLRQQLTAAKAEKEAVRKQLEMSDEEVRALRDKVIDFECRLWEAEDPTVPSAWLLRKQAEAVEGCKIYGMRVQWSNEAINEYIEKHAQHLRQQADEASND